MAIDLKDKTICVIVHGRSCEELENRIEEFKDLNIVWGSMSSFDIPQKYILDKINKKFDVIFDSGTVQNAVEYELQVRIPRFINYFNSSNGYYICTKSDRNNLYELRDRIYPSFNSIYKDRIICCEDIGIDPNPFCVSLHLYIASLYKLGAKTVILFGADGGGTHGNSVQSYYKWEEVEKDKIIAGNPSYNMIGDTNNINTSYSSLMTNTLGYIPEVLNCSPITTYTVFKQISFNEVIKLLNEGK